MTENQLEQEALRWLADVGYTLWYGPDIAMDGAAPERCRACNHTYGANIETIGSLLDRIAWRWHAYGYAALNRYPLFCQKRDYYLFI